MTKRTSQRRSCRETRSASGFTLIELMVTLTILMILSVAALPNVLGALKTRPLVDATHAVMNIAQFAKSKAASDFRAYGMTITPFDGMQPGLIAVYKGSGPQCSSVDTATRAMTQFDLNDETRAGTHGGLTGAGTISVRLIKVVPRGLSLLCFTPDGRVVDGATSLPIPAGPNTAYGAGDAVLVLQRFIGNTPVGLRHNAIIPFSGAPFFTFSQGDNTHSAAGEGGL